MRQAIAVAVFLEKQKLWGQAIGVEVTRSKDTLVAFMGVLLSGNYYVPVSREMPEEKVEKIRQQINLAAYLYADHSLVKRLPEADEQDYKRLYKTLEKVPEEAPLYVVFTSGSTGVLKGIIKSHQAMTHIFHVTCQHISSL